MKAKSLFIFLCHIAAISAEIRFECRKQELLEDYVLGCSLNAIASPEEFDSYLSNLTALSYMQGSREVPLELTQVLAIVIENIPFAAFPAKIFEKFPKLRSLTITANIRQLKVVDFFNGGDLMELNLSNNLISSLEAAQFQHLASISLINLAYNNISAIDKSVLSNTGRGLRNLDLSHNKLTSIEEDMFGALISGQESITVDLSYNLINFVDKSTGFFNGAHYEIVVDLSSNNIDVLMLKNRFYAVKVSENAVTEIEVRADTIIAQKNQLESFFIDQNIQVLKLDNNKISSLKWDKNLEMLEELDLSDNGMDLGVISELFDEMPNVGILDLSGNRIGDLSLRDALQNLKNLRHLSLKDVQLTEIDGRTFENSLKLQTLILSHNELLHIDFDYFLGLNDLEVLRLESNHVRMIRNFEKLGEDIPHIERIGIADNLVQCKLLREMYDFLESFNIEVIEPDAPEYRRSNVKGIACLNLNDDIEPLFDLKNPKQIAYKFEELIAHIKTLEETQKQIETEATSEITALSALATLLIFLLAGTIVVGVWIFRTKFQRQQDPDRVEFQNFDYNL